MARRRAVDGLDQEIRDHIDRETEDLIARGLSREEARRRAMLAFGNVSLVREDVRAVWSWIPLEHLLQDVFGAVRALRRTPGLSAVAVLCLAVAIGLTTAAFSVMHGAFLSPLPVANADNLVIVHQYHRAGRYKVPLTAAAFTAHRERSRSFEALGAWYSRNLTLGAGDAADSAAGVARAAYVSPGSLDMLGVAPLIGRHSREDDVAPGASPVVLLGHDLWRDRLGSDARILGRAVEVAGTPHRVIGVMPPGFAFPTGEDLWIPAQMNARATNATGEGLTLFGRLHEGVSPREAATELAVLAPSDEGRGAADTTVPLVMPFTRGFLSPDHERAMYGLLIGLALFLVVIAANLGNLFLARNAARAREIALRAALGASRVRLMRPLLIESLALGAVGLLLGLAVSRASLVWFQSQVTDLPWWADFALSPIVFGVAAFAAVAASAAAGIGPALRLTRASVNEPLREGRPTPGGLRFSRAGTGLIVAQVAVGVGFLGVLGVLAQGLFGFSYQKYQIAARDVLIAQVYLGPPDAADLSRPGADRREVWRRHDERSFEQLARVRERLREQPGVRQATFATHFPGNDVEAARIEIERATAGSGVVTTRIAAVGPDFFETLGTRLVSGRDFAPDERTGPPRTVVVNLPFARKHFPDESPLGRRLRLSGDTEAGPEPWLEIIGVAPDLGLNPGDPARADGIYVPFAPGTFARLAIRADAPPAALVPDVHDLVRRENASAQVQWAVGLDAQMSAAEAVFRGLGAALFLIGGTALLLSAVSFYSLVSFSVTQRTREIGIRRALGATRAAILTSVLGRELAVILAGAAAGVVLGAGLYRLVSVIPFDLRPAGPALLVAVAGLMLVVGAGACLQPSRRAMSIEPADALRHE